LTPEDGKWQGIYGLIMYVYQLLFVFVVTRIYPEDGGTDRGFKIRECTNTKSSKDRQGKTSIIESLADLAVCHDTSDNSYFTLSSRSVLSVKGQLLLFYS